MKNPVNRDEFEIFLEEEVNQHRMYPSDQIWRNIQQEIHGHKKWPALTVVTLFVISALVVGTILIKPQHQVIANTALPAENIAVANTAKQQPAENAQEHFSPEHITRQTIENVQRDIDLTDNFQTAFADYNNNIEPLVAVEDIAQAETVTTANTPAQPVSQQAAIAKAPTENNAKNNIPVFNWMAAVPEESITLNGQTAFNPNAVNNAVKSSKIFRFSLFEKFGSTHSSLALDNNFTQPVRKSFTLKPKSPRLDFAFYATPSISYRSLTYGSEAALSHNYVSGIPYNANYTVDLGRTIRNKPAMGYEVGAALGYKLNKTFTLRGGLQFNMREYDIVAYKRSFADNSYNTPAGSSPLGSVDVSNQTSASINGDNKITLQNRYYQISMPVGIDATLWKSGRLGAGVATSIQPTYIFDKDPFIITSDYKSYIDGSKLVRNWNINSNFEAYLSYTTGDFKWQIGPQFRYQLLSTISGSYPIKEHLLDYGIKIGVVKRLR